MISSATPTSAGGAPSSAVSAASDSAAISGGTGAVAGDEDGDFEEMGSTDDAVFAPRY